MRLSFSLLFSFFCFAIYSQSSISLKINFSNSKATGNEEILSLAHKIPAGENDFEFIGVSAYCESENIEEELWFRLLAMNEKWGEWQEFKPNDHGITKGRSAFEAPFINEKFKEIQFKASKKHAFDFNFRLYFPPQNSQEPVLKTGALCSCAQPAFCDRNCWCPNNDCPKDPSPSPTQSTHIIVHHSAGANTSNDFSAVVAYYWDLHVNTNGWDDIGYNWLIDPNGVIYEGRGDGVGGAHFSCMNGGTTGICLIGNFQNQAPKNAAIAQLKNLIAWEACDKNISPNQSSYHASSMLNLENISGHKDGNNASVGCPKGTACPGTELYLRLDSIRMSVDSFACIQGVSLNPTIISETSLEIYPNPSSREISLKFQLKKSSACKIEIINPLGQVLKTWNITNPNPSNLIRINVEDWDKGLYKIKLSSGNEEFLESLMIY